MAGALAKLVVSLGANVSGFETDMKRATSNQKKRMKEMERQVQAAGRAIGVAFAAAGASMAVLVRETTKTADEMQKLSQRTGVSTEALSQYQHVAELSGVSMDQFTNGLKRMQRSISDADVGLSTQVRAFERLGISVEELMRLSPEQQFEMIADAMVKLESATLRSATAQEIFGRSGTELLSVMANGAAGIQELRAEADRLGLTIGQDFADNAALFNDNMERIKAGFTGAANQLTAALLPSLLDLQQYFMDSASASDFASSAGEKLGAILKTLAAAFVIVKNAALGFGKILLGIFDLLLNVGKAVIAPISNAIRALIDAFAALKAGDFAAAGQAIANIGKDIGADWEEAGKRIKTAGGFIVATFGNIDDGLEEVNRVFTTAARNTDKATDSFKDGAEALDAVVDGATEAGDAIEESGKQMQRFTESAEDVNDFLDEMIELFDDANRRQAEFEQALQGVLDRLYPVQAAGRDLGNTLEILTQALNQGVLSWNQYQDAVNRAVAGFDAAQQGAVDTAQSIDLLQTAVDEGVRILERAFTDMWASLLNGSELTFDALESGFKQMLANLAHQALTQPIIINIQQGLQEGGSIDWVKLGKDFATYAAVIGSSQIFGGGKGASAGAAYGASIGSLFGPWGAVIGSLAGGLAGGLNDRGISLEDFGQWAGGMFPDFIGGDWIPGLGGLFNKYVGRTLDSLLGFEDPGIQIGGIKYNGNPINPDLGSFETALGEVFGFWSKDMGHFFEKDKPGGQLADAIIEFDRALYDVLSGSISPEHMDRIIADLEEWGGFWQRGEITLENILGSRFNVILATFADDIQAWVNEVEDLDNRFQRLGIAAAASDALDKFPELFGDRTLTDILSLVEEFADTMNVTIGEAFEYLITEAAQVASVMQSLRAYADSDLAADLDALLALQNISLREAVGNMQESLFDAIANWDGSSAQLTRIGEMAIAVRDGELRLLAQIDALQKGLSSNLKSLRDEIAGIDEGPQTFIDTYLKAQQLARKVGQGVFKTPEELAAVGREFETLIRGLDFEALTKGQRNTLLSLIDVFDMLSNQAFDQLREETISEAESMRQTVDRFLEEIGDPLTVIANALEGENLPEVMSDGLDSIAVEVAKIGPQVADAIDRGLSNVNITVAVTDSGGLVTQ